ncbi:hypothetical protein BC827DRAFT_1172258 [Russula dissimulans]|nr:hypothetical protein BC827DRAFT_1172258 [Russula dissimulans]
MVRLLHKFQPGIHRITYFRPCGDSDELSSKTDSGTTTIAMFSEEYQEWGQSNTHTKHTTVVPSPIIPPTVDDPGEARIGKGVIVTPEDDYVVAEPDSLGALLNYMYTTKFKPLSEAEVRGRPSNDPSIVCPIDNRIFLHAVRMPCCKTVYCKSCIRTHLLESDFICPHCGFYVNSLDELAVSYSMEQKVADYIMKEIEASRMEEAGQSTSESTPASSVLQVMTSIFSYFFDFLSSRTQTRA